ncbi:hypothetical protein K2173_008759 [Erythroxylum novogranatense]|uniref:Bifunctional inhibitor/plant lipid transfer protein/seed storage helical domain-containing protein n=1 Tax=Erythroxylum novogranatense TaxID=1862640 RepID=A0AAV8S5J0_9ROSI|nr:hypothetical protein K2173_008759 [Erythroxylum novogranatense]
MAKGAMKMVVALALVTILWAGAAAQSDCTNVLISMSPCLNYISGNSSTPSSQCCSQLATVVRSSPQCLCQVLNGGGSSLGININQTQALALPGACNVQTPSTTRCNAASPAGSPPTESPEGPSSPTESTPSGSGSRRVPSRETEGASNGNSIKLSIPVLFFLLFAASFTMS